MTASTNNHIELALLIVLILMLVALRLRFGGAEKVERVEEEFGEVESFELESLEGTESRPA